MVWVMGPNGAVVRVSESLAKALIGDGSHGCRAVPNPRDTQPARKPATKRAPRKTTTK